MKSRLDTARTQYVVHSSPDQASVFPKVEHAQEEYCESTDLLVKEIAAEVKSELQQELQQIQHALNNIDRQINKDMSEIKSRMQLHEDTLTMLGTQRLAQASGAGPYVPEPRGVGPTARYLTEPRSRWKPTWFYSH